MKMKIILNKDVDNLGEEGDICEVARGYARNYLFPKELALAHTKQNIALIENRRSGIEKRKEEKRQNALSLKERLENTEIVIKMNSGQGGKLFGSVTNAMISDELQKEGIEVEKKRIEVSSHTIKMIGTYPVRVRLYDNNEAQLKITVVGQKEGAESAQGRVEKKEEPPKKQETSPVPESLEEEKEEVSAADVPAEESETPAPETENQAAEEQAEEAPAEEAEEETISEEAPTEDETAEEEPAEEAEEKED